jgi:TonB family protein
VQETFVYSFRDQSPLDRGPAIEVAGDRPAEIAEAVVPMYPHGLQHAGVTGKVTVLFKVDATGQVTSVGAVDATDPNFIAPTLEAARHWSFKPAIKDGKPVAARVQETFRYDFRDPQKFESLPQVRVTGKH